MSYPPASKTICGKCGLQATKRAQFCGRCGSPTLLTSADSDTTLPGLIECSACHEFREVDGEFCEHCGAKAQEEPKPQFESPLFENPEQPRKSATLPWVVVGIATLAVLTLIPVFTLLIAKSFRPVGNTAEHKQSALPTPSPPESYKGMVLIPGGEFMMGDDKGDEFERPAHRVVVQPFYIDQKEVTCAQYAQFLKATSRKAPPGWLQKVCSSASPDLPATGVDWFDANAYARWRNARLPTEEEWEYAARANDGRKYTWGNIWLSGAANAGETGAQRLVDVGSYPKSQTPSGLFDMTGNAWEWTSSQLVAYPSGKLSINPTADLKVIRGGSWQDQPSQVTTTYRGYLQSSGEKDYSATGFRCVVDARSNR